ncbi:CRISPR-associated endoribonuclease Cas6 [Methanobrevibacter smithii]|jgi:CRISPR-associated endoribonuclease Cas6|uniref:CRISPR-associated endoribonuclease Cas6 n=2 Tax=Methanobrevibacter smithii TaxID=2173 RepID=UPI0003611487|nr:CRISPR-associated endoribonuclease Cas6 [Methanobrevibacter smithii]
MRLEIILKGKNNFKVPFNYNHILSAIIYNKIADLNFANELHSSKSFKFFTFSQIYIPKRRIVKDGIIAKDGVISFYISSPNDFLIKSLVDGFLEDLEISFQNQKLTIQKIEALKTPEFSSKSEFKTLAPIIVRTKKEIDGELKIWDLAPSDKFFKSLENNLIKKYIKFNNLTKTDKKINIYSDMNFVKRKRISINKDNATTHHRAYMMDLILEGDLDLIEFAYDVGIGEKNSMGFGMVKLLE